MDLLRRWRLRRAAKQYARRLGPHLRRAYGAAEYYTAPQIRAAVPKLGLKSRYIVLGYAAFLSDEEFASRANEMPISSPASSPPAASELRITTSRGSV
jgi:hypothetical protein